jgi:hypothetical protein
MSSENNQNENQISHSFINLSVANGIDLLPFLRSDNCSCDGNSSSGNTSAATAQPKTQGYIDAFTALAITFVCMLLITVLITAVVAYKLKINYELQRQINMFKRIDEQLGRHREYTIDRWACRSL